MRTSGLRSGARGRAGVDPLQRTASRVRSWLTARSELPAAAAPAPGRCSRSGWVIGTWGAVAGVVARLPGAPPTGMGFSGPFGPRGGVQAPWPFTVAALHVLRRDVRRPRARRLCTHARSSTTGPVTSRTSPPRPRVGIFIPISAPPVGLRRLLSRATASLRPAPRPPPPCGCVVSGRSASLGVVQRSPLHRNPRRSPPIASVWSACAHLLAVTERGCHSAFRRLPARVPTSSFGYDLAGLLLQRLSGCCARLRSWGSTPFAPLRLSPPPRSRCRAPALRSFALRWKPPDPLTRATRRLVTRAPLPTRGSPSPLPPRPWSLPTGTSRPCSSTGAVPPCLVSETDGPLLPWACPSRPAAHRNGRMDGTSKNVRKNGLSVPAPGSPVAAHL